MHIHIIKCDICGSTESVESRELPVYRTFDGCDGKSYYDRPEVSFVKIDICAECLRKATNIHDKRVFGYGPIGISANPLIKKQ